jgi:hypothetical protein
VPEDDASFPASRLLSGRGAAQSDLRRNRARDEIANAPPALGLQIMGVASSPWAQAAHSRHDDGHHRSATHDHDIH